MLRPKRQLSQGNIDDDVRPPQRPRLDTSQQQEIGGHYEHSHENTSCTSPYLAVPQDWTDVWAQSNYNPVDPWSDVQIQGQAGSSNGALTAHASPSVSGTVENQLSSMRQFNIQRREEYHEQTMVYDQGLSEVNEDYNIFSTNSTSLTNTTNSRGIETVYHPRGSALDTTQAPRTTINLTFEHHCSPGFTSHQEPQVVYNQPSSNAPVFNGNIYGSVKNSWKVTAVDCLQFLDQYAAMGAIHESDERYPPPLCHPGTRESVVDRAITWYLNNNGRKKIMWVHAPLGYGKTAVAGTVKEQLDGMSLGFDNPVGATFFFWRSSPQRNSPSRFITTLAYQLVQSIPELRPHVDAIIQAKPNTVKMVLEVQLVDLIVNPFKALGNLTKLAQRLIIVDGIDECIKSGRESHGEKEYVEDQEAAQIRVLNLIHRLHSHHLPLSFLILSRPEAWIARHLTSKPFCDAVEPLDLYEVGEHMKDVTRFVRAELSRIAASFGFEGVDEEWADEQALVRRSEGVMVYAVTVIRHIDDEYGNPRALLRGILANSSTTPRSTPHSRPFSSLYELYRQIMRSCPERNRRVMTEVLEDVIVSLSTDSLAFEKDADSQAGLRVLDTVSTRSPGDGLRALRPLHAVLRIGKGNEATKMVDLVLHSSFAEFLSGPQAASEFGVDLRRGRLRLLSRILDLMARLTPDTIGQKPDDSVVFALDNWCHMWWQNKEAIPPCIHIPLLKKISTLDLTTCFIQYYLYPTFGYTMSEDVLVTLLNCSNISDFFLQSTLQSRGLKTHPDAISLVSAVTSLIHASLDHALAFVLEASAYAFPSDTIEIVEYECVRLLTHITALPNWKERKIVQALGNPGPSGMQLFREVVEDISHNSSKWERDLLEHIYETMVQSKNPILDEEDHPFRKFLEVNREPETAEAASI
ncbi:hypothetical protein MD484_g2491, partial [Candolleomyces efflorescens]